MNNNSSIRGRAIGVLFAQALLFATTHAQTTTSYTSSGTFVAPAGVTSVVVECWGGGGRGGGKSGNAGGSGGGGGGAYVKSVLPVVPGNSYTVTVGAGSTSDAAGGDSWFNTAGTILAKGGNTVLNNTAAGGAGGTAAASIGTVKFSGGLGATSGATNGGGGGSSAGYGAAGNGGTGATGGIAPIGGGNGGDGRMTTTGSGLPGVAPGGGGGGSYRSSNGGLQAGGSGATGRVIVHSYLNGSCMSVVSGFNIIPDNVCGTVLVPVTVTGLPTTLGNAPGNARLVSVELIVAHTNNEDLDISLTTPGGITRNLVNDRFGTGDNLGNPATCPTTVLTLEDGGAALNNTNTNNATGTFSPEQTLVGFTGDPNGAWVLNICDDAANNTGNLVYVELNFQTVDCLGVLGGPALPGTGCDDLNACTTGDTWSAGCACVGTPLTDTDSDGTCDLTDTDDDNDGVLDGSDADALNTNVCEDADGDTCDDCAGTHDGFGPLANNDPGDDGLDTDGDGACDFGDTDDDNDGVLDGSDADALNTNVCEDTDGDTCDDCAGTHDGFGPLANNDPADDGPDGDADGICDAGDPCDNNTDGDPCTNGDPCVTGETLLNCNCQGGVTSPDTDGDGFCDAVDTDDDNDGVLDGSDTDALNTNVCEDADGDTCDDCAGTHDGFGPLANNDPVDDGLDSDSDGLCDAGDNCPNDPGVQGDPCDDGNAFTSGDVLDSNCDCVGIPQPCDNWTLTVNADANGSEISWTIVQDGTANVLATGPLVPYPANSSTVHTICVPHGNCWDLTFTDAGGNGITPGGWVLRDHTNRRVIDNFGNGGAFASTAVPDVAFCSPIGTQALTLASCDRENWLSNEFIVARPNLAVSAEWMVGDQTDDGYGFWFFDPVGGYSRRILHSHANSMGFGPPSATRACHMPLNFVTNPLPQNVLLNVRVRSLVNGVYSAFGPACRFKLDAAAASCPTTQLDNNPMHVGTTYSCGVTGKIVGASGYAGKIYALPVLSQPGNGVACSYRFVLTVPAEGYTRVITIGSYALTLGPWFTNPLLCGTYTYDVTVRASFDCTNYCPVGASCTVEITNNLALPYCTDPNAVQDGGGNLNIAAIEEGAVLNLWPNPNAGDQLYLELSEIDAGVSEVIVDLHDAFGKRVMSRVIPVDGPFNTVIDLEGSLANGLYLVNLTAGEKIYTQRLVIH